MRGTAVIYCNIMNMLRNVNYVLPLIVKFKRLLLLVCYWRWPDQGRKRSIFIFILYV